MTAEVVDLRQPGRALGDGSQGGPGVRHGAQLRRPGRRRRLSVLTRRPELVPLGAAAVGWAAAFTPWFGHGSAIGGTPGAGPSHLHHVAAISAMTLAMMSPLAIPLVRTVSSTSTWWRVRRAVLLAFAAFALTWMSIGLALHVVVEALSEPAGRPARVAGAALVAFALLQLHPRRKLQVLRCGRPRALRARGWTAEVDCLHLGADTAARCGQVCGLPMLAMVAVPSSLVLMAGLTAASLVERVWGRRWPAVVAPALALASGAVGIGLLLA
jgi:hypothetical protein